MMESTPFTVRQEVVVKIVGGNMKHGPWLVHGCVEICGVPFITLRKSDRQLANALGMQMSDTAPFRGYDVFAHLAATRDKRVDGIIAECMAGDDPMADTTIVPSKDIGALRAKRFHECNIPHTVQLDLDEFVTEDGERVPGHKMDVVTTPKCGMSVTMAAIAENFDWLAKAVRVSNWLAIKKRKCISRGLPDLAEQLRYIRSNRSGGLMLCCDFH